MTINNIFNCLPAQVFLMKVDRMNRTEHNFYLKQVSVHAQVEYEKKVYIEKQKYMQDIHNMGAVLNVWI